MAKLADLVVGITGDDRPFNATAEKVRRSLTGIDRTKVEPRITIPGKASEDVEALSKRLQGLSRQRVALNVNATLAKAEVQSLTRQLETLQRSRTEVPVELQSDVDRQIADVRRELAAAERKQTKIPLSLERVDDKITAVRTQIEALGGRSVKVPIDVKADVNTRMAAVAGERAGNDFNRGFLSRVRDLAVAQLAVNSLSKGFPDLTLGVDGVARSMTLAVGGALSLGAALVPLAAFSAGGLLAVGPALAAGAAGAGVAALAFKGVGTALTALQTAHASSAAEAQAQAVKEAAAATGVKEALKAVTSARSAASQAAVAASRAVADAVRGVEQAEGAAAEASRDASQRVKDARTAMADATRTAADNIRQALDDQVRSERDLTAAQGDARRAQQALNDAREDARRSIEDLNFDVREGVLREKEANLSLADARARLAKVNADPKATQDSRQRALLDYQQQQLALEELSVRNKRLGKDAAEANRAGVNGSKQVKSAQQQLADAQQKVIDQQEAADEAAANVARTRTESARTIQRAERGVTEALREQSKVAEGNARSIANAERALSDARAAQTAQAARGAESITSAQERLRAAQLAYGQAVGASSASQEALNEALAGAGVGGAAFAIFLDGLRGKFGQLQAAAQGGLLTGLTAGIQSAMPALPGLVRLVEAVSAELGNMARAAGQFVSGPEGRAFINFLTTTAPPMLAKFGEITGNLVSGFLALQPALMPLTNMMNDSLLRLSESFEAFGEGGGIEPFVDYIISITPMVNELLGNLVGLVGDLIKAILPLSGPALTAVNAIVEALRSLVNSADFAQFVSNIGGILKAVTPLFGTLADVAGQVFKVLSGQVLDLMPVLVPALQGFAKVFGDVLVGLSPLLPALVGLADALLSGLLPAIVPIIPAIREALIPVVDALADTVVALVPLFELMADGLIAVLPLFTSLLLAVIPLVTQFVKWLTPAIEKFVQQFKDGEGPGGRFRDMLSRISDDAERLGGWFVDRVVPAVKDFIQQFKDGEGPGGRFRDLLGWIADKVELVYKWVVDKVVPAIGDFIDEMNRGEGAGGDFKDIITAVKDAIEFLVPKVTAIIEKVQEWSDKFEEAKTSISGTKNKITEAFENMRTTIRDKVSKIGDNLDGFFGPDGTLRNAVKNGVASAKTQTRDGFENVRVTVRDKLSQVKDRLTAFWGEDGTLRNAVRNGLTSAKTQTRDGFENVRTTIRDKLTATKTKLTEFFGPGGTLRNAVQNAVRAVGGLWGGIKDAFDKPWDWVQKNVFDKIRGAYNTVARLVGAKEMPAFSGGGSPARTRTVPGANGATFADGGLIPRFAAGGRIRGVGGPREDNIMGVDRKRKVQTSWVSAGEFVVNEKSYRANREIVEQVNSAHGPLKKSPFADGGQVPGLFMGGTAPTNIAKSSQHRSGYPWARWAGDLNGPGNDEGNRVNAWKAGVVAAVRHLNYSYGKHVKINHGGEQTLYAHLSRIAVDAGQRVRAGQQIGNLGNTGNSFGPHLHFEIAGGNASVGSGKGDAGEDQGGLLSFIKPRAMFSKVANGVLGVVGRGIRALGGGLGDTPVAQMIGKLPGKFVDMLASKLPESFGQSGGSGSSPNGVGRLGPRAQAARQHVIDRWGITNIGGYANRNIAGTNTKSKHSLGKAIDVMTWDKGIHQQIANEFVANAGKWGTDNVITQRRIWNQRGWHGYNGIPHYNHVHVDFHKDGGEVRGLASGGIVKGGRGGVTAQVGEGRFDELVTPLPRNWNTGGGSDTLERIARLLEAQGGREVRFDFTTYNPVDEPQSVTTNKALQRVAELGLV